MTASKGSTIVEIEEGVEDNFYRWHFEGPEMQALAASAKKATRFHNVNKGATKYTDQPSFELVKEGDFYLMDSHDNRGFRPHVARPIEYQDEESPHPGDDYVVTLPMDRDELDDLVSGKMGLWVSVTPLAVEWVRYFPCT
jgi:hypothetical protein